MYIYVIISMQYIPFNFQNRYKFPKICFLVHVLKDVWNEIFKSLIIHIYIFIIKISNYGCKYIYIYTPIAKISKKMISPQTKLECPSIGGIPDTLL